MGGKNKKGRQGNSSAVQVAIASASKSRVTVDQRAAGEEKKPGPKPANVGPSNKELKSKQGPKTYSFASPADASSAVNHDKSILKVVIDSKLEKRIISLINEHKKQNSDEGTVSGRLTSKKLQDLYVALQELGFKAEHIEEAMTNTVLYGGDLHSALDWLCLNLPDDALPEGFSQQFVEEEQKTRAKYQPAPQAEISPKIPNNGKSNDEPDLRVSNEKELSMKEWILQYAAQGSDAEEETDVTEKDQEKEHFDPNERYLELTAKLLDARTHAASTKQEKDKQGQKEAQDKIRIYLQDMKALEEHPMFNPQVKISEVKPDAKKSPAPPADEGNLNFNLFEHSGDAPSAEEKVKKKSPLDIRNFDYSTRSWTGKSPKQFLIDWCRKHFPKSPNPSFEKVAAGRYWKSRVKIIKSHDDVMSVSPTIVTEDSMQAQHLAATLALYLLTKGQSVHQLLPPTYRDVWLEWSDEEKSKLEQNKMESNKPREQFISKLMNKLKLQQQQQKPVKESKALDDPEDSWENLASEDEVNHVPLDRSEAENLEPVKNLLIKSRESAKCRRLLIEREQLPVFAHRDLILETLNRYRVIVVAGETGSGKSTQVPQFLLEDLLLNRWNSGKCNIVCTQPRRISAMSLATRVCDELGCETGPGGRNSLCGYQIRMESRTGEFTRLLYCTTGILLRKLQEDSLLKNVTHVIVDEVHERTVQSDFLLIILKEILHKRSDLHLVLMSATVDAEKFSKYFTHCPIIRISGRTYPVEVFHLEDIVEETDFVLEQDSEYCQRFLEDDEEITLTITGKGGSNNKYQEFIPGRSSTELDTNPCYQKFSNRTRHAIQYMNPNKINLDLILELLMYLDRSTQYRNVEGAVLIFLPGLADIQQLYDLLSSDKRFQDRRRYKLIALHSILSSQDQAEAFILPPPGTRKIVLATNIAETGITIPDVVFVIDTGRTKENRYHESSQMSSLVETFISKASALQRQGRAGRVQAGFCFRLFTSERFENFMSYSIPEILRVPLEELCLHIMKCDLGSPEDFLSKALDPPQLQVISNAMNLLRKIGACELTQPKLTPLGQHLAALPVNVKIGKMLIFGAIFGCLDTVAILAATMTEKSPFITPIGRKDEADLAKSALAIANSDHLTIYKAYTGWRTIRLEGYSSEMSYCRKNFLNRKALLTIEDVKQELIRLVRAAGFESPAPISSREHYGHGDKRTFTHQETPLLKAVLTAGLYDNVGKILYTKSVDVTEKLACMVETAQGKAQVHPSSVNRDLQTYGWLLYQEKVKYSKIFLKETTLISPFPILLFGGDIEVQHRERLISVDDWICFQAPVKIAVIFKELRVLIESVLMKKLQNPKMPLEDDKILSIIKELIRVEQ